MTTGLTVALLGAAANPAGAAGTAAGVVTGTVTVTPGLTATGTQPTSFNFTGTTIAGAFVGADATEGGATLVDDPVTGLHDVGAGGASYEGFVTTGAVTGGVSGVLPELETCAAAVGHVNPFLFTGSLTVGPIAGQTLTHTVTGDLGTGLFIRVGPVVEVVWFTGVTILVHLKDVLLVGTTDNLFESTTHSVIQGLVTVLALFLPTVGQDCVTVPVTSATFAGDFKAAAV